MRITLILFLFLFSWNSCFSQGYYKIPADTNHYWRQFSICFETNKVNRFDYQIRYYRDTVINSKIYNLYERFGRSWGFEFCTSFTKRGFLRQDTLAKKVFILDTNFIERPLYNFSKVVGDTLLHYNKALNSILTLTVQQLDTAYLFDGTKHKAQWVSNSNCFIEGVGSIFGGLYGDDQLMSTPNNISEQLMCYGFITPFYDLMDGITQQIYICSFVPVNVGLKEYSTQKFNFSLFPNPSSGEFDIIFNSETNAIIKYTVCDLLGREIKNGIYNSHEGENKFPIKLLDCSDGMYILSILNSGQELYRQKVLKE